MPDQPTDTNRNAIKVALGAALGSALGIITAVRTLSSAKQAADREQDYRASPPPSLDVQEERVSRPETRKGREVDAPPAHPDWELLPAAHLPRPTYWPVVLALGIVFLAWGVVTAVAISAVGLALLTLGLGGWIGELRHGHG